MIAIRKELYALVWIGCCVRIVLCCIVFIDVSIILHSSNTEFADSLFGFCCFCLIDSSYKLWMERYGSNESKNRKTNNGVFHVRPTNERGKKHQSQND